MTRYQLSPIVDAVVVVDVLLGGSGSVPVSLFRFHFLENLDAVFSLKSCTQDGKVALIRQKKSKNEEQEEVMNTIPILTFKSP